MFPRVGFAPPPLVAHGRRNTSKSIRFQRNSNYNATSVAISVIGLAISTNVRKQCREFRLSDCRQFGVREDAIRVPVPGEVLRERARVALGKLYGGEKWLCYVAALWPCTPSIRGSWVARQ